MPQTRYDSTTDLAPLRARPAAALRRMLREGYGASDLRADLLAGIVVGIIALPLSMALAIASGVPPQHGLYTAIVAGAAIALLGGSRFQVSGPTAAFVVVLSPIAAEHGLGGLLVASMLAGAILMGLGIARLGGLIQFVPHPVTTGFTAGIAVVIATLQLRDFLGLDTGPMPAHYLERVATLARALPTAHLPEVAIGSITLATLLAWPRLLPRLATSVPGPLVALVLATLLAEALRAVAPELAVATIASRFTFERGGETIAGIPNLPPMFALPWTLPAADGHALVPSFALLRELVPAAFTIAMLGAIESLLSSVIADGMTGTRHDPDTELLAQGAGNLLAPFFGGFAATGAIARTATNIRAGARTPMAALFHAAFVLAAVLALAPALGHLPMTALAAMLLLVAWNMSELKHFGHVLRVAPRSDVAVLLICFGLTVIFDMVIAVSVGILLAALLFMRRMAEISDVRLVGPEHDPILPPLPKGVLVYDLSGPLFFGAAQKAMSALDAVQAHVSTVLLDVRDVPIMDATGLVNLESAIERLRRSGVRVILGGVQPQPAEVLARAGIESDEESVVVCERFDDAVALARLLPPRRRTASASAA